MFLRVLFLCLAFATVNVAADEYERGYQAYQDGDYAAAYEIWLALANEGSETAQANIGIFYRDGKAVKQDLETAVAWFRKSAESGDARAQKLMGDSYRMGQGVNKDLEQSLSWYEKAMAQSYPPAYGVAGWVHTHRGDYTAAFRLITQGAGLGDAYSQYQLGLAYADSESTDRDPAKAAHWMEKAAKQGVLHAKRKIALWYGQGFGVPQDNNKAADWMSQAARNGDAASQYYLGLYYRDGKVVTQDTEQALLWLGKAADQDFSKAYEAIGIIKAKEDLASAMPWFKKGAEKGMPFSQYMLGLGYEDGLAVEKDIAQAVVWLTKSAEQGRVDAQVRLGNLYYHGDKVRQDYVQAAHWYTEAAEQGDGDALNALGVIFSLNSDTVEGNAENAAYFFAQAAQKGAARSENNLNRILKDLTFLVTLNDGTYVHAAPESASEKLLPLNKNDAIYLLGEAEDWWAVYARTGHTLGYVPKKSVAPAQPSVTASK